MKFAIISDFKAGKKACRFAPRVLVIRNFFLKGEMIVIRCASDMNLSVFGRYICRVGVCVCVGVCIRKCLEFIELVDVTSF